MLSIYIIISSFGLMNRLYTYIIIYNKRKSLEIRLIRVILKNSLFLTNLLTIILYNYLIIKI